MAERTLFEASPAVQSVANTIQSALTQLKSGHYIQEFTVKPTLRHRREVVSINVSMVRKSDGQKIEMHFSPFENAKFGDFMRKLKSALGI